MGLLDLLPSSNLGLQGSTPAQIPSANPQSTLHYQSSINNIPALNGNFPTPSVLDLNGQTPTLSTVPGSTQQLPYINNLPG
jgi:hypothetical protein